MPNQTATQFRQQQGATTVSLNTLINVVDNEQTKVATLQEVATALGGYATVAEPINNRKWCMVDLSVSKDTGAPDFDPLAASTLLWNQNPYDLGGFFDIGSASRLTVPAGVSMIRIDTSLLFHAANIRVRIIKNGTSTVAQGISSPIIFSVNLTTGEIPVIQGDYFELQIDDTFRLLKSDNT